MAAIDSRPVPQEPSPSLPPAPSAPSGSSPTEVLLEQASSSDGPSAAISLRLVSRLAVNPGWPGVPDLDMIARYAAGLRVTLTFARSTIERLQRLHEELLLLEADEVSDWAIEAHCIVEQLEPDGSQASAPNAIGVGATVYATGEVHFSLNFQDLEYTLWLKDTVEIDSLLQAISSSGAG